MGAWQGPRWQEQEEDKRWVVVVVVVVVKGWGLDIATFSPSKGEG